MPRYDYGCEKCGKIFEVVKHMWEDPEVRCKCGGKASQHITTCFRTDKDQLFNFVDVHTTGKPLRFTSKRQWNQHLKKTGKYQLSSFDLKKLGEHKERSSDYSQVVKEAWKERSKFVNEVKYGKRRLNYG